MTKSVVNKLNRSNQSKLISAIKRGNTKKVIELVVTKRVDLNIIDSDLDPLLSIAIRYDRIDIIKILMDNNAPLHHRNKFSCTPLHIACKEPCNPEITRMLLDHGARTLDRDEIGLTPMSYACYYRRYESICFQKALILIKHSTDLHHEPNQIEDVRHFWVDGDEREFILKAWGKELKWRRRKFYAFFLNTLQNDTSTPAATRFEYLKERLFSLRELKELIGSFL